MSAVVVVVPSLSDRERYGRNKRRQTSFFSCLERNTATSFDDKWTQQRDNDDAVTVSLEILLPRRIPSCCWRKRQIKETLYVLLFLWLTTAANGFAPSPSFCWQRSFFLEEELPHTRFISSSSSSSVLVHAIKLKQRLEQQQFQDQPSADSDDADNSNSIQWFPSEWMEDGDDPLLLQQLAINLTADLIRPIIYNNNNSSSNHTAATDGGSDSDSKGEEEDIKTMSDTPSITPPLAEDDDSSTHTAGETSESTIIDVMPYVKDCFLDLCGTREGEQMLEQLFVEQKTLGWAQPQYARPVVVKGAVLVLQRLCVLGMSYGLTMTPFAVERSTGHMPEPHDEEEQTPNDYVRAWTSDSARRLKYQALQSDLLKLPAIQLLAAVKKRQSSLGAYELLTRLGAWQPHENLALLRSGVPIRFSNTEEEAATEAARSTRDPDDLLGIRQDLRHLKLFTIDGADASEIDDGLSVEVIKSDDDDDDNTPDRLRYWVHIADADRWAPRDSELFQVGRKRATSVYVPDRAISMLPSQVSIGVMSLKPNVDSCALSLGVELDENGKVIDESLVVTPSTVRVTYRLTYKEVDEMLEDGIAYQEERELGQLFAAAQKRKRLRYQNGSIEKFVPNPIPQYSINVFSNDRESDGVGIKVKVEVGNNSGKNQSAAVEELSMDGNSPLVKESPVSAANTLVTEMMILAGEAMGRWAQRQNQTSVVNDTIFQLPFRSQPAPDYKTRSREKKIMTDLLEYNIGGGYCHAWYSRRFLSPVKTNGFPDPHSGLGLPCYVQWTSPIRRFQDMQAHAAVKRFIRRQRMFELVDAGEAIPQGITSTDVGCELAAASDGTITLNLDAPIDEINYQDRTKWIGPIVFVQRNSQKYWMHEYLRRLKEKAPTTEFEVLVLGCIDPAKRLYAIYVYGLGFEWKYASPVGLQAGMKFKVRIGPVAPNNGQLTFVRVV